MTLKEGKRYVRRDGKITGPLSRNNPSISSYPFWDQEAEEDYTAEGCYLVTKEKHKGDLIREYVEPAKKAPRTRKKPLPEEAKIYWPENGSIGNKPTLPTVDLVNQPPHYKKDGVECIDVINAALTPEEFQGFLKGNAIKYLFRHHSKGTPEQDLAKAGWYLSRVGGDK
jgi:hypothetical protein